MSWSEQDDPLAGDSDPSAGLTDNQRVEKSIKILSGIGDTTFTGNPFNQLKTKVLLAASARSGSNLLCERLQDHGARIGEVFNPRRMRTVCKEHDFNSIEQYCEHAVKTHGRTGVFGVKGSLTILAPLYLSGEFPHNLSSWKFVYLRRVDTVKQAISHLIAQISGTFRSVKAGQPVREDQYDQEKLVALIAAHQRLDANWVNTFANLGVEPFRITYELLAEDPSSIAAQVAEYLELPGQPIPNKKPPTLALQKQANSLNAIWEARLREERPDVCATIPQS